MRAFTLIETLVVISCFIIVFSGIFGTIAYFYRDYYFIYNHAFAVEDARRGISIMSKELRNAQLGDGGYYILEKADDKEIIFYSDIDNDGQTERVRYFIGAINSGSQIKNCVSFSRGGTCSIDFSDFLSGEPELAQLKISVEGDLGASNEYVDIDIDGEDFGRLCASGCSDCAGSWQGTTTYDVFPQAEDNSLTVLCDSSSAVHANCDWVNPNHSFRAEAELTWTEETIGFGNELKKGITEPAGAPIQYPDDQEKIVVITKYIRNDPPVFTYYDSENEEITEIPARLIDAKLIKIHLVIDLDVNKNPEETVIESFIQPRNMDLTQ